MFKRIRLFAILAFVACSSHNLSNSNEGPHSRVEVPAALAREMKAIEPFFHPLPRPGPMDWLASNKEPGQTFEEYMNENPTLPSAERRTIFVLPLGKLDKEEELVVKKVAEFLNAFYGLPTKVLQARSFPQKLPADMYRVRDYPKRRQIKAGYILNEILSPALPADAAALIALTDDDLYPDESMNFVFGQASFEKRVGVWSLNRLKDKDDKLFLVRALKIAAHETGHMFSMHHCTKYECVMNGSNHILEIDSHPLDACPECMAKIAWLSGVAPKTRYERLETICAKFLLDGMAEEFREKLIAVKR